MKALRASSAFIVGAVRIKSSKNVSLVTDRLGIVLHPREVVDFIHSQH